MICRRAGLASHRGRRRTGGFSGTMTTPELIQEVDLAKRRDPESVQIELDEWIKDLELLKKVEKSESEDDRLTIETSKKAVSERIKYLRTLLEQQAF